MSTVTADLAAAVRTALAETTDDPNRPDMRFFAATKLVRNRLGVSLPEASAAVRAVLAEMVAPGQYLAATSAGRWSYAFPNGRTALVTLDPGRPLRFVVADSDGRRAAGLTTGQVEAALADIYCQPATD